LFPDLNCCRPNTARAANHKHPVAFADLRAVGEKHIVLPASDSAADASKSARW
jgi:hypothetical protein